MYWHVGGIHCCLSCLHDGWQRNLTLVLVHEVHAITTSADLRAYIEIASRPSEDIRSRHGRQRNGAKTATWMLVDQMGYISSSMWKLVAFSAWSTPSTSGGRSKRLLRRVDDHNTYICDP